MTTLTLSTGTFLAVNVPEGAERPPIDDGTLCLRIPFPLPARGFRIKYIDLPPGSWTIIGTCSEILNSEELAAGIAKDNGMGCWHNYKGKPDEVYTCRTAAESFECLCVAYQISKNSVILKDISNGA